MWVDKRSEFDSAHHLVAGTAYSQSFINLGGDFDIGPGNPLYWVVLLATIAEDGSTPTYTVTLQTDDNSSFTSPEDLVSITIPKGSAAGTRFVVGFPITNQKYLRVKYVLADGGATADVTLDSFLTDQKIPGIQSYPQNINA